MRRLQRVTVRVPADAFFTDAVNDAIAKVEKAGWQVIQVLDHFATHEASPRSSLDTWHVLPLVEVPDA